MLIFQHLIKDTEIIGIGPLYAQPSKDTAMLTLYQSFRYEFEVHTKTQAIKICSDFFKPGGLPEHLINKEQQKATAWKQEYYTVRNLVAGQIGEILNT